MNYKTLLIVFFVTIFLAGCSADGLSNAEAKKAISGVYLKDVVILEKKQCEPSPQMLENGETNVWLVQYKDKDSSRVRTAVLSEKPVDSPESNSQESPWFVYAWDQCPTE